MNKKLKLIALMVLALICLISGGVFAAPQSSPKVAPTNATLKNWVKSSESNYIGNMKGTSGVMGVTVSLDVHLQRNTEYGAMLILGISDYGKQASGVSYTNLFSESVNGLPTTTGNVSGIYNIVNNANYKEWVAAGIPDSKYNSPLSSVTAQNRDTYTTSQVVKKGDALNLFTTNSTWLRVVSNSSYYYNFSRYGFDYGTERTYDTSLGYGYELYRARAVVTQYN